MKLSINRIILLLLVGFFVYTIPVSAEPHARPNFRGVVIDKTTKQPIKGIWVQMQSGKHGGFRYAKTDDKGVFLFRNDASTNDGLANSKTDGVTVPNCMLSSNGVPISTFDPFCPGDWGGDPNARYPKCSNCRTYQQMNTAPGIPGGRRIMAKEDWGCASTPFIITAVVKNATAQLNAKNNVLGETTSASNSAEYKECNSHSVMMDNETGTVDLSDPADVSKLCKRGEWKYNASGKRYLDCYEMYGQESLTFECAPEKKTTLTSISQPPKQNIASSAIEKDIACVTALPCVGKDLQGKDVTCSSEVESSPVNTQRGRIKLTSLARALKENPSETKPAYLVQCSRKGTTYDCSTGKKEYDDALGLKNTGAFQVQGIYAADGKTPVDAKITSALADSYEWETSVPAEGSLANYSFYIVAIGQSVQQNGGVGGQQQGTLTWSGCTEIQDPKGRVFDSHTLEPLSNANVALLKQQASGSFKQLASNEVAVGFKNPITTKEDGAFSFFVPDGTYKLQPTKSGYSFPYNVTKLNKNVNDFYTNLYKGQALVQKGEIIHTDIPLDPLDKKASEEFAKNNPAKILSHTQTLDKNNNTILINGKVSHPRSKLSLFTRVPSADGQQMQRSRLLRQVEANNEGYFTITINISSLQKGEIIGEIDVKKHNGFSFEANKLTSFFDWMNKKISVQAYSETTTVTLDPILNYVEGYAKDEKGTVLPNATVQVIVPMMTEPVVEVVANNEGLFQISSDKLPAIEYKLVYIHNQNKKINVTNTTFVSQNIDVVENNVDFYAYKPTDGSKPAYIADSVNKNHNQGEVAGVSTDTMINKTSGLILFVMIIAVGSILALHINRKKNMKHV